MCDDVDECIEDYPCSQTCINTPGSYKCSCDTGYIPLDADSTRCKADSTEEFMLLFTSRYEKKTITVLQIDLAQNTDVRTTVLNIYLTS